MGQLAYRDRMPTTVSTHMELEMNRMWLTLGADLQGIAYEYGTAGQVDAGKLLTFDTLAAGTPPQGKFDASTFKVDCFPPGSFPLGTC